MEFSHDVFLKNIAQTTGSPFLLDIEKAEGLYLYSPSGKKYMDLISGIAVSNIGHRHPDVVKAVKDQVDRHFHVMVYGEFVQSSSNLLAHRLISFLPQNLNCCYFTNSGTEANEGALKLAKRVTGRTELIAFRGSYHGSTHGSLSVSGNEYKKFAFRPLLPDVRFLTFNKVEDLDKITRKTAAVIIETIQGDAGVRIPDLTFLQALRQRCDETGAILIFDEIQTGIGRTGKLFAFEHYGIIPDILTTAKALGGGLPLGAFIASYDMMQTLTHDPMLGHITTFGGNPVSCAASLATLNVVDQVLPQAEEKGKLFESLLQHPRVKEIRRKGLMFAIEFNTPDEVYQIVRLGIEKGIICFWFLSNPNSFRIAPPLTITDSEIREACRRIQECFDSLK
ncbi:aspartate aminotransferase family protein [Fulvivirga sedimenti]|uniref:Aspartate aminotransferase family protein n=1 Tax=Fulvivirga sedimenti TaxID=2879465 RepID=A0A9X1HSV5_9BACT|nr:aspartate aminotransferase family protein [Fulvivirga sedimenti]MCA6074851.1 aspartate aminotransferase family protein [Fulvivirga sedimenti]MCA6076028.1 aspartate aminotransferase family protein [Fulvivirga sedimenti]MCA6077156.1 aspartate aminotransferase family protein [Fulvivirga sedimenti]